ncbi:DUF2849 domain-containing protein [Ferrovibrio sp.]|uniref:DUF2849 domain-containing protein n=1 Tax=Ferrovibrio sp. TaxID=1917215 RepID=UPI0035AECCE2
MAKAPKLVSNPQIVTANDLASGDVVYLTKVNSWTRAIEQAAIAPSLEHSAALLAEAEAQARRNIVVAPYAVPVTLETGNPLPVQFRERIRAAGPTAGIGAGAGE